MLFKLVLNISRSKGIRHPPFPRSPIFRAHMATTVPEWQRVSPDSIPPFFVFNKPIQKSLQDDREYRIIRLENGLHATLVHDASADSAAASLDVAVGHLSDPVG
jgi:hypothetical protein